MLCAGVLSVTAGCSSCFIFSSGGAVQEKAITPTAFRNFEILLAGKSFHSGFLVLRRNE